MDNVFVRYIELPATIHSFVVANKDLTYTIVLNSRLSHEQNLISYQHELDHILHGDYEKKCSADFIEINSHKISNEIAM
jgi:hypothetical protein